MNHNQQRGSALIVSLSIVGVIVGLLIWVVMIFISANNYAVRAENTLKATWEDNQNVLGNYTLKVQEAAAVPAMYTEDLKQVMTSVMTARMGADGSKAVMQWFKEANIPFDSSLYGKIQVIVEAGRNEFQGKQTKLIDQKREYQNSLGTFPRGVILGFMGFPKIDLEKYKPVVAGDTRKAFETGVQAPVLTAPARTPAVKDKQ